MLVAASLCEQRRMSQTLPRSMLRRCLMAMQMRAGSLCQQPPPCPGRLASARTPTCSLQGWRQRCTHRQNVGRQQADGSRCMQRRLVRRRRSTPLVPCANGSDGQKDAQSRSVNAEATGSELIRRELVLFLIQQVPSSHDGSVADAWRTSCSIHSVSVDKNLVSPLATSQPSGLSGPATGHSAAGQ